MMLLLAAAAAAVGQFSMVHSSGAHVEVGYTYFSESQARHEAALLADRVWAAFCPRADAGCAKGSGYELRLNIGKEYCLAIVNAKFANGTTQASYECVFYPDGHYTLTFADDPVRL